MANLVGQHDALPPAYLDFATALAAELPADWTVYASGSGDDYGNRFGVEDDEGMVHWTPWETAIAVGVAGTVERVTRE